MDAPKPINDKCEPIEIIRVYRCNTRLELKTNNPKEYMIGLTRHDPKQGFGKSSKNFLGFSRKNIEQTKKKIAFKVDMFIIKHYLYRNLLCFRSQFIVFSRYLLYFFCFVDFYKQRRENRQKWDSKKKIAKYSCTDQSNLTDIENSSGKT